MTSKSSSRGRGVYHQQLTQEHIDFCQEQWGLTLDTIQQYQLGFAPVAPEALQHHLRGEGFAEEAIHKSGLVIQVGQRWHDFFQGRIVFPLLARSAACPLWSSRNAALFYRPASRRDNARCRMGAGQVSQAARAWDQAPRMSRPRSTNTYFYGEHALRGLKDRPVLVTEGVADCLVALQADIPTISPVTVRFCQSMYPRLLQLARQAQRLLICNDNEDNQAGTKGALATAAVLDAEGIDVRLVTLPRPDGVRKIDLADFLKSHPAEDFQRLCDEAPAYLDARLATYPVRGEGYTNCQTARQFVTEVLCQCPDEQSARVPTASREKRISGSASPILTTS